MSKPVQVYESPAIKVTFDPNVCTHSGNCVRGLPDVFNVKNKPWIQPGQADVNTVEQQVARCPSGALRCQKK